MMLKQLLNRVIGESYATGAGRRKKKAGRRAGYHEVAYDGYGARAGMVYSGAKPMKKMKKMGAARAGRNPWLSFLRKYRKAHPGMAPQMIMQKAAKQYRGMGARAGLMDREVLGVGKRRRRRPRRGSVGIPMEPEVRHQGMGKRRRKMMGGKAKEGLLASLLRGIDIKIN